jgi:uncharacterized protein (DUF362 family)
VRHDPERREVLRRLGQAALVLGGAGAAAWLGLRSPGRFAAMAERAVPPRWTLPRGGTWPAGAIARGGGIAARVRTAVDRVGGIGRFVQPGATVLLKPNMAWDRTPEQGANTQPEVVAEVARMCREARAARVIVAEVPVHDPERAAERSGIRAAAREAGAELAVPPAASFRAASLGGSVLDEWEVLALALGADRLINLPVVKDHALSRLTCGMKNLYGLLGGTRGRLHQRIHESIADLAAAFTPTLTIVDATLVMMRGGPQGGRVEDLAPVRAIAAGTDPVALDAWGATLLGVDPRDIGHVVLAEGRGLGRADPRSLEEVHADA